VGARQQVGVLYHAAGRCDGAAIDQPRHPVNLTAGNLATDTLPAVSPDGRTLAYVAMDRPGYEADRQELRLRDLATGETRQLADGWDRSVGEISWSPDGRSLIVGADDTLEHPLFRVDIASGAVTRLTGEGHTGSARALPTDRWSTPPTRSSLPTICSASTPPGARPS
jgi:Tol biopolymer transport system component